MIRNLRAIAGVRAGCMPLPAHKPRPLPRLLSLASASPLLRATCQPPAPAPPSSAPAPPRLQVGWATGPAPLVQALAKAHQFLVFTVPSAFQRAVSHGLDSCQDFYTGSVGLGRGVVLHFTQGQWGWGQAVVLHFTQGQCGSGEL